MSEDLVREIECPHCGWLMESRLHEELAGEMVIEDDAYMNAQLRLLLKSHFDRSPVCRPAIMSMLYQAPAEDA